ncbi:glycosyltransferase [Tieghemostelium lacteum]|uniref:GDP-Man:Man(3)GlcNAc(2)-PP-Dol alpha-1,2-mannosyltransferase n=1 Tax=Tieghemostelium lacteum TaxID=361077 RepID=A0A152A7L4_TIELA|nr:glycosyltransferase [Tieghemostelium lacteum]|eukprot:KYR02230.1 glycosyltransferase [Tieghemostelium lacteum]
MNYDLIVIGLSLILTIAIIFLSMVLLPITIVFILSIIYFRYKFTKNKDKSTINVAFFHPYCTAGGGGERVLWCAIRSLQNEYPGIKISVYTGDQKEDSEIFAMIKKTFNLMLDEKNCHFIRLKKRGLVEASRWPRFTLIGQSLGSMVLAWEALNLLNPDLFIDSMGYAFTYPIFKIFGGSHIAAYIHYPTISTDMLSKVSNSTESYNNNESISKSKFKTSAKLIYYKLFSKLYYLAGKFSNIVMCNGTWTANHIRNIWKIDRVSIVYPPVDVESRKAMPLNWMQRENIILSIAQFRPEKDHPLQLYTLAQLLQKYPIHKNELRTKLVMVGSCRDQQDRDRVESLRKLSIELGIESNVEFKIGIPIQELNRLLEISSVGIHTMWCEHFGIGVVELAAAGVIPVAHNSAGPKEDIVKHDQTGFLASTKEEYAEYIHEILAFREKYKDMQQKARESVDRFSQENFENHFKNSFSIFFDNKKNQ